jgi:hypothetical protein
VSTLPKKLLGFGAFIGGGQVILSLKCANVDDLVLLAKEDMELKGMANRLKEIGIWYGMEMWKK